MIRRKKYLLIGTITLFVVVMGFAGCTSKQERLEKQEAYRKIGINAMEEEKYIEAIEAFDTALEQASAIGANEIDICYYKAAAQFAVGSFNSAIETYNALLEYDDKSSDTYFLRGCVYLKTNESAKAEEDFAAAVKYAKDDEIYLAIYNSLNGAGYEAEGKVYLEEALEKKTGRDAKNYTVKGRIYLIKEQYKKAVEELTTAIEKGDAEANLYLAQAYEALEKPKTAEQCLDVYIKEYPKSSVAYNQLGYKEMEAGNYEKAVSYFGKGLELDEVTNEQELRRNLIAAYEYSGDFESAKAQIEEYVQNYPEDISAARENMFLNRNGNEATSTE